MDLNEYQAAARKTLQHGKEPADAVAIPLLGLLGEAGAIATAYKKQLRDGRANPTFKAQLREELGDALWYLAMLADQAELDLADVAAANLHKVADRWRPTATDQIPFDQDYPPHEQLPRTGRFILRLTETNGTTKSVLTWGGQAVGDPLTNASHIDDDYRMHDIFHLSYATVLGWSPVMRSLLRRKRRSNPHIDEAEDGGRAIAIEEGISALVFSYASRHNFLDGKAHIDNELLDVIGSMVGHLEVGAHRAADWEKAILTSYTAWRQLRAQGGGVIDMDMSTQSLTVSALPAMEND
ncbi:nucleoside triphosphate pyrophosphohydrolase family protein [Actinomadura sp. CNU-125]|uniref:nucleoside triphosphate pyrophosphohydrolase family protein n=1 Tax=Actinomadura sp. CNU-125 TaxID=1904961 RepID=UPI0011776CA6|nr:nucleoside triphosphate pyrophosphohydrolase family protein [Actinomadura sp. CNU-125]